MLLIFPINPLLIFFNLPKDGTTTKTEGKQSLCVTEVCPQSYHPTWSLFSKCYLVLIHVHWWPAWSVAWLSCSFWCHGVFFTSSLSSFLLIGTSLLLWLDFWSQSCMWVSVFKALLLVEGDLCTDLKKKQEPNPQTNKIKQKQKSQYRASVFLLHDV